MNVYVCLCDGHLFICNKKGFLAHGYKDSLCCLKIIIIIFLRIITFTISFFNAPLFVEQFNCEKVKREGIMRNEHAFDFNDLYRIHLLVLAILKVYFYSHSNNF